MASGTVGRLALHTSVGISGTVAEGLPTVCTRQRGLCLGGDGESIAGQPPVALLDQGAECDACNTLRQGLRVPYSRGRPKTP